MTREEFKNEISKLIQEGESLHSLFVFEKMPKTKEEDPVYYERVSSQSRGRSFSLEYQKWYSKCLVILRIIEPDRLEEFHDQYQPAKNRKDLNVLNFTIYDSICGVQKTDGTLDTNYAYPRLLVQIDIIRSLAPIVDQQLDRMEAILQTDVFDEELGSARLLLKNKYYRAAGALCGVILEKHFKTLANKAGIVFKKEPTLNDYNQELHKANVLDTTQFKFISYLSDIRNKCDHAKTDEPTPEEIEKLISGTDEVIKTY